MTKLDNLIQTARQHPDRLTPATLARVNTHLLRSGQPAIVPAVKSIFGRSYTLAEIAAQRTGQPLPPPQRPAMTPAEFQQQQLERAQRLQTERNEKARRQTKPGLVASFMGFLRN